MSVETTPDGVRVFYSDGSCTAILVDETGVRAGAVADLNILGNHLEWWVARVLVSDPVDRGKGLGSLVLQAALKAIMVSTNGMARVVVVPGGYDNNHERQRKFYEKNGFRSVNEEGLMECGCSPESH
jgi:GNAT superfamily N-acetyltransferase